MRKTTEETGARNARRLLVSVRSADEATIALRGGASILDIKEPAHGPLGRASASVHAAVVTAAGAALSEPESSRAITITAALGELCASESPADFTPTPGVAIHKLGLSGGATTHDWSRRLGAWKDRLARFSAGLAAVAYADHGAARAPSPSEVLGFAVEHEVPFFLVDTFSKSGGALLDFLDLDELIRLTEAAHDGGVQVALAGSLRLEDVHRIDPVGADVVAVRGAACRNGARDSELDAGRIRALVDACRTPAMNTGGLS